MNFVLIDIWKKAVEVLLIEEAMAGPRCHTCGPMTSSLMHLSMPDRPSQLLRLPQPQPQPRNRNASLPPGQPQSINHLQCSCSLPHSAESEISATCIPSQDYRSASRRQVLLASGAAIAAAAAALPAYADSQVLAPLLYSQPRLAATPLSYVHFLDNASFQMGQSQIQFR